MEISFLYDNTDLKNKFLEIHVIIFIYNFRNELSSDKDESKK